MNDEERAWSVLGIAPTDDPRAIRDAYARQLKQIDPEADPQSFILLRAAYDAVRGKGSAAAVPTTASSAFEAPNRWEDAPAPADETPASEAAPPADEAETHARAIQAILYGHEGADPWLGPEARDSLIAHWRALVGDPRMEELAFADRVERWASIIIAETSPLSVPILMIAAERFKWIGADRAARSDPHLAEIARRYRMLTGLHSASRPGSPLHAAWIELTTPTDTSSSSHGKVDPGPVLKVLGAMRYALPELEREFDPVRVGSWERYAKRRYQSSKPAAKDVGTLDRMANNILVSALWSFALASVAIVIISIAEFFR